MKATLDRYKNAADDHKKASDDYTNSQNNVNKDKLDEAAKKLKEAYEEISKKNIGEFFTDLYNKYNEFVDGLTPDKIVCLFNMLLDGLIFSFLLF